MSKKLYIFRGLPGSGKTSLARKLAPLVIENDMFRYDEHMEYVFDSDDTLTVHRKVMDLFEYAVRHLKLPAIAVANVHTKVDHFRRFVDLAKKHGYKVTVYEMYGHYENTHHVPDQVVRSMAESFEPLSPDEACKLGVSLVHVKGEQDGKIQG